MPQSIMIFRCPKQRRFDVGKNEMPGPRNAGPPFVPSRVNVPFPVLFIILRASRIYSDRSTSTDAITSVVS